MLKQLRSYWLRCHVIHVIQEWIKYWRQTILSLHQCLVPPFHTSHTTDLLTCDLTNSQGFLSDECIMALLSDHKGAIVCDLTWSGFARETVFVVHCKGQKDIRMDTNSVSVKHVWSHSGSLPYVSIFVTDSVLE